MKRILMALGAVALAGLFAASHAQTPMSDADKAAAAAKAAAAKAKEAELLGKAQDRAAANYKKNKGIAMDAKPAAMGAKAAAKKK
jgi:hypothetical protein